MSRANNVSESTIKDQLEAQYGSGIYDWGSFNYDKPSSLIGSSSVNNTQFNRVTGLPQYQASQDAKDRLKIAMEAYASGSGAGVSFAK